MPFVNTNQPNMKYFFVLLLICTSSLVFGQQEPLSKTVSLVGRWIGTDDTYETGGVEFFKNGTAKLYIQGQEIFIDEYKADFSKDPIWLDLTAKRGDQTATLHGLIAVISPTSIKWEVFLEGEETRPVKFSGKANSSVVLKKQQ